MEATTYYAHGKEARITPRRASELDPQNLVKTRRNQIYIDRSPQTVYKRINRNHPHIVLLPSNGGDPKLGIII